MHEGEQAGQGGATATIDRSVPAEKIGDGFKAVIADLITAPDRVALIISTRLTGQEMPEETSELSASEVQLVKYLDQLVQCGNEKALSEIQVVVKSEAFLHQVDDAVKLIQGDQESVAIEERAHESSEKLKSFIIEGAMKAATPAESWEVESTQEAKTITAIARLLQHLVSLRCA